MIGLLSVTTAGSPLAPQLTHFCVIVDIGTAVGAVHPGVDVHVTVTGVDVGVVPAAQPQISR